VGRGVDGREGEKREVSGAVAAVVAVVLAVAIVPATIGYALWVGNHVTPRLVNLPIVFARMIAAFCLALPWIVIAGVVWVVWG
jgi:hypothetical protein